MFEAGAAEMVGRLVRECGGRAFKFAYRLTGSAEEAKDLVQEAYRRVLLNWKKYDQEQPLDAWFLTILRHLVIDAAKRYDHRHIASLDGPVDDQEGSGQVWADVIADGHEAIEDALARSESSEAVRRAFDGLTRNHRLVLTLCDMQGLPYDEIARVMGVPQGTVRSRVARARRALRALLVRESTVEVI